MGDMRNAYTILVRNEKERDQVGDVGVDKRIILKCILNKKNERLWNGFI